MATAPGNEVAASAAERAKPPFLRRVRIRGYKSIAFCDVTLEPLTVLVGRNASGKSNFLDALAVLRDLMDGRATEAVQERGGWGSIHCRNSPIPQFEIDIEATVGSRFHSVWDAAYSFSLERATLNQVQVYRESLTLSERGRDRICGFHSEAGKVEWIGSQHFEDDSEWTSDEDNSPTSPDSKLDTPHFFAQRRSDRLLLSVIGTQPFLDLSEGLRASNVYNFSPAAIRALQPITASPTLQADGSNLARAIEGLRELDPGAVERIERYLAAMVEGVGRFQTVRYGEYETVQFQVTSGNGKEAQRFDALSMSDGTLRILSALIAAYQLGLPADPGFVAIEEPETSLHPAAMRALVDALDEATVRTQILLTTHSADMLDNPTIRPENVRVVEMVDGQTVIAPVDEASVEIVRRKLDTLGGLERQNQLQPDADDVARQQRLARDGQEPQA